MSYSTVPPSVGASSIAITAGTGLSGDGSTGTPLAGVAADATHNGYLAIADFDKLATVPTGSSIAVMNYSSVIDLTTTGVYAVIPAQAKRLFRYPALGPLIWGLETVGGTRSTNITFSVGSNAPSYDNLYASATGNAALLTAGANTANSAGTAISPFPIVDLTTDGLKVNVTVGITGASPVCTARMYCFWVPIPV